MSPLLASIGVLAAISGSEAPYVPPTEVAQRSPDQRASFGGDLAVIGGGPQLMVRADLDPLDEPVFAPWSQIRGFPFVSVGFVRLVGDAGHRPRIHVYSQRGGERGGDQLAVTRLLMRLWEYNARRLRLDHARDVNESIVEAFLDDDAERVSVEWIEAEDRRPVIRIPAQLYADRALIVEHIVDAYAQITLQDHPDGDLLSFWLAEDLFEERMAAADVLGVRPTEVQRLHRRATWGAQRAAEFGADIEPDRSDRLVLISAVAGPYATEAAHRDQPLIFDEARAPGWLPEEAWLPISAGSLTAWEPGESQPGWVRYRLPEERR